MPSLRETTGFRYIFDHQGTSPPWAFAGAVAVLLLAVFLVYLPTLPYPFQYDDVPAIVENPGIRVQGYSMDAFRDILGNAPRAENRPIAQLSFALNYRISGMSPSSWRAVNILIHLLNTLLVLLVAGAFLGQWGMSIPRARAVSWLGAGIWGLHPLNTQAVTYVVQRMTSLMTLFFLLGLFLYLKGRSAEGWKRWLYGSWCVLSFLLALGTKENAAVFPFVILLMEVFLRGGFSYLKKTRPRVIITIGLACLAYIAVLGMVYLGSTPLEGKYAARGFTMGERVLTQSRVLVIYLSLLLVPLPSRMTIDRNLVLSTGLLAPVTTLLCTVFLVFLMTAALVKGRTRSLFAFSVFWFLGTIFLESSLLPLDLYYEHRMYLPAIWPIMWMSHSLGGLLLGPEKKDR